MDILFSVRLFNICFSVLLQSKPLGLKEMKAPFLYGILVKRSELSAAMFTPSRLLLQLGNKMHSKSKKVLRFMSVLLQIINCFIPSATKFENAVLISQSSLFTVR